MVLAERVGWTGSISWFRENVARLRPQFRPIDPTDRLTWSPGDAAQCDLWFPPFKIPLEDGSTRLLPVLVITVAHSRFMLATMIPTRTTEDLLLGMWELLERLGRVPRRLIWDNEPGIGRGRRPAEGVAAFMGTLATKLVLLPPRDPESKGIVERRNGWFETSFMPGRTFSSPRDFNEQLTAWLVLTNARVVRTTGVAPANAWPRTWPRCWPLPPTPLGLGWHQRVRLSRDYYVRARHERLLGRPSAIGRIVDVSADLDRVRVRCDGRLVAEHARRFARAPDRHRPGPCRVAARLRSSSSNRIAVVTTGSPETSPTTTAPSD